MSTFGLPQNSDTHPCEVSYIQGNPFACVGVHNVGWGTLPSLWATWCRQRIQVVTVFWSISIVGWWGYYIIIQVDLLVDWVVSFLLSMRATFQSNKYETLWAVMRLGFGILLSNFLSHQLDGHNQMAESHNKFLNFKYVQNTSHASWGRCLSLLVWCTILKGTVDSIYPFQWQCNVGAAGA